MSEADTCRKYVVPKLQAAGWEHEPHSIAEQRTFTDGRIVVGQAGTRRKQKKRADYLLRYTRDYPIAVVEAKAGYQSPMKGLQQAKEYAEILGLKFAYSTNGKGIVEFDYTTGELKEIETFPTPEELFNRLRQVEGLVDDEVVDRLLSPFNIVSGKQPRYYQEIAINRSVQSILQGQKRILLTMATGTGKTFTAFQICWKLWSTRWNLTGEYRRPKILFLADRNVLVDDPKDKTFTPFGDARWKLEGGVVNKGREMYFATYQSLAKDKLRPGLYREYDPDFFDLIIVDECHRGSARDDSNWREILTYFQPATQLGLTATPKRDDNVNTYLYFGNPIYTYSLKQGIEDGFLAPYRVHRVISSWDRDGYVPSQEERDKYGRTIPEEEFQTKDFDRAIVLKQRTKAIARHLTEFLQSSDRMSKTLIFCVDEEHAADMLLELTQLNSDLVKKYPDYICRVTSEEGNIGRGHLSNCQDVERNSPVILTTSKMLTTGVDIPTCKTVVLMRVVNSMTEFKQIIGRGTRVREDYGKLYFSIVDYTGSATRLFADSEFDGDPALLTEEEMNEQGQTIPQTKRVIKQDPETTDDPTGIDSLKDDELEQLPRKYYADGGQGQIIKEMVYDLDPYTERLRLVKLIDYTGEELRTIYQSDAEMRQQWANPEQRSDIVEMLRERGIDFEDLKKATDQPDADPLDLLCHLAFNAPLLTRRQRAEKLKRERQDFFDQYGPEARAILEVLVDKYAEHGIEQFAFPETLKVPPLSSYGNVVEIAGLFGGAENLREAFTRLQEFLYAA
jgi:type I restriction enzyme R subunit